jgi:hypothetical protein
MKSSILLNILGLVIACSAAIAAVIGLFWRDGGSSFSFSTLRSQITQIYGRGLYRYDTLFFGAGFKGQDAVVLFLGVPLLIIALLLTQQESACDQLLLTGMFGYFLYVYSSMALGASYNRLFLLYIIIFSASLFAFILSFSAIDLDLIAARVSGEFSNSGMVIFMFTAGLVTLLVWGGPLVKALLNDTPPERMESYTTMVTYALDLAIITPATVLCAILVLKGDAFGYAIAVPLLTVIILLAPQIILSTIFQRSAGVPFTTGEMVGPVAGFVTLGLLAFWLLVAILKVTR